MEMTQQDRLDGIKSFTNFLIDHSAQVRMLLNSKKGVELIEMISEVSKLATKSAMETFRDHKKGLVGEKANAGEIVSSAEQLSRLTHQISISLGEFWADHSSSLFKLLAGMEPDMMFQPLAQVVRDEGGSPQVLIIEGVDPSKLEIPNIKSEIENVVAQMEANPALKGATIARPADQITELLNYLQISKGGDIDFEEHQRKTELPAFIKTEVQQFAFMITTYAMHVISQQIGNKETTTATAIGMMSVARTMGDMMIAPITLLPNALKYEDLFREVCNSTYEDFISTYRIRDSATGIHEAMSKVASGEMTKEEFTKLYDQLKDKQAEVQAEESDKFVFAAPASVQ